MNAEEFCNKYAAERLGTSCVKWDLLGERYGDPDLIPMWVADMDFRACEAVTDAMSERVRHGVFGYTIIDDDYYDAFFNWEESRHGYRPQKEWLRFSSGVVCALYWCVNAFTKPDDAVTILTPVYYPFQNAVNDTGRRLVPCRLENTNGFYTVDFQQFERDIVENKVKLFIHCSPHNPVGRCWTEEELDQLLCICKRHGVLVVSDEIHQDIIVGMKKQIPAAVVSGGQYAGNLIMLTAPSKTFNLAGLQHSHIIIENSTLRAQYDAYAKTVNKSEPNIMALAATKAAYRHGAQWLAGALAVVSENYRYAKEAFEKGAPEIIVSPLEGTYLMWLDFRACMEPEKLQYFIQNKCRLAVDLGEWFGTECKGFIRLNLATEPRNVKTAVENILKNMKP